MSVNKNLGEIMLSRGFLLFALLLYVSASQLTFAATNFNKLSYGELRTFDTSNLDAKAKSKYQKAWKKAVKNREKIISRAKKKHDNGEVKRIKKLSKSPEISAYNRTSVAQSEFDPVPVAKGPETYLSGAFSVAMVGYGGTKFFMRSVGTEMFQIYVVDSYSGKWKTWDSARLTGGEDTKFISISRDVLNCADGTCKYSEHFGVGFSKAYLSSWYVMGGGNIRMEVRGTTSGARKVLEIPESYIYGFIDKVNETFDIVDSEVVALRRAEIDEQLRPRPFVVTDALFN